MAKIGIVAVPFIPSEFQLVFMVQTIMSLKETKHLHELDFISIINGYAAGDDGLVWLQSAFNYIETNDRNNLSRAWNKGVRLAFARGADYVLVINLDLIFHPDFVANLVSFAENNPDAIVWSGTEWKDRETLASATMVGEPLPDVHFACFMIDRRLYDQIGEFDEQFEPAYHEDSDMLYRIRIARAKVLTCPSALFYHLDRVTLKGAMNKNDTAFLDTLRVSMDTSMERYKTKWGGLPGGEKFSIPYNRSTK